MTLFRIFLISFWLVLAIYTIVVIKNHGINLFAVFFGDMSKMAWPGQFNLDFMGFLLLSGFWVLWRHEFTLRGWLLLPLAFFGGVAFLAPYLLILIHKNSGDMKAILMGQRQA